MVVMSAPTVHINNSKFFTMASLNSQAAAGTSQPQDKAAIWIEKGFTLGGADDRDCHCGDPFIRRPP